MEITNVAFYEISRKCSGFYRRGNCVTVNRNSRNELTNQFYISTAYNWLLTLRFYQNGTNNQLYFSKGTLCPINILFMWLY